MSKRAGKKRTPEIEREQFEAYGEYTYDYLHAQDGEAGDAQAGVHRNGAGRTGFLSSWVF